MARWRPAGRAGQTREAMEDEFEQFVAASASSLRRTAYLMCGDWHRAEDIVQIALAKVYVHWSRIDAAGGAGPYARRAVVNAAIDESRRPWRREHSTDQPPDPAASDPAMSADPAATWDEADEMVHALRRLPARQRAVVILRYAMDYDIDTTARLLDVSSGTVKSQAAKGLALLRERVTPAGVREDGATP